MWTVWRGMVLHGRAQIRWAAMYSLSSCEVRKMCSPSRLEGLDLSLERDAVELARLKRDTEVETAGASQGRCSWRDTPFGHFDRKVLESNGPPCRASLMLRPQAVIRK